MSNVVRLMPWIARCQYCGWEKRYMSDHRGDIGSPPPHECRNDPSDGLDSYLRALLRIHLKMSLRELERSIGLLP